MLIAALLPKAEKTKHSTGERMREKPSTHTKPYSVLLSSNKDFTLGHLEDTPRHYDEWEKPVPRCHIYCTIPFIWNLQRDKTSGRKEIPGCRGYSRGKNVTRGGFLGSWTCSVSWLWLQCLHASVYIHEKFKELSIPPKVNFTVWW